LKSITITLPAEKIDIVARRLDAIRVIPTITCVLGLIKHRLFAFTSISLP
jgi:hypothetical protein